MTPNPQQSETPQGEIAKLKAQVRLMAIAIRSGNERAEAQQVILEQLEARVGLLERLAKGINEQN